MNGPIEILRTGAWLTRARMRLWALAVLTASIAGLVILAATSDGLNDYRGRPLGTDFSNIFAAGTWVLDGRADAAYDPALQYARAQAIFGEKTPFYGWHYPPFFLFAAALLALMPYALALIVWQGATLVLYLVAVRAILAVGAPPPCAPLARDRLWLLLALAFPAVLVNLGHGHNGFLTAALLSGALVALDRRPHLAGVLLGLIAYKPQFGLMLPVALAATGRWRSIAAAAATIAVLALATVIAFGPEVWRGFLTSTRFTRIVVLEAGDVGWHKIQTVFAWVRMWGGPVGLAYALQGAVAVALAAIVARLWRSTAAFAIKAAALAIAVLLATPYSLDYDMMLLAPAIAFLVADGARRGFRSYEKTALFLLWLVPLFARSVAEATLVPIGVLIVLGAFLLVLRRTAAEVSVSNWWRSAPHPIK